MIKFNISKESIWMQSENKARSFTEVGCYPLYYILGKFEDVENNMVVSCPPCLTALVSNNDSSAVVMEANINYEENDLICDLCHEEIESAYGDGYF